MLQKCSDSIPYIFDFFLSKYNSVQIPWNDQCSYNYTITAKSIVIIPTNSCVLTTYYITPDKEIKRLLPKWKMLKKQVKMFLFLFFINTVCMKLLHQISSLFEYDQTENVQRQLYFPFGNWLFANGALANGAFWSTSFSILRT